MPVVDAVVDDRDLHPLARGRQPRAPEGGRADGGRAPVELRPVARAPVHGGDAVDLLQPSDRVGGDNDRKRVQDDPVTPADLRARDGVGDPAGDLLLLDAAGASAGEASSARRGRAAPASAAAATGRRTATRARRRPAPDGRPGPARDRARRQARAAPPRARPRGKRHVSDAESYVRDVKNSADPGCTIRSERKEDRCARPATAIAAARTATARTATASTAVFRSGPARGRGYNCPPRGCGGIGRRARFRSVWGKPRGGSSPLIRIAA